MFRVVHYLNQFFAGLGGEEAADAAFEIRHGPVGPGRALQMVFGNRASVTHTLVCGDNRFHDDREASLEAVRQALENLKPDLVVAGPAFNAGRYGLACGAVCALAGELGTVPAVTGLFPESPGAEIYHDRVVIVPTANSAAEMKAALDAVARIGLKLAAGEKLGPAAEEGILSRGFRGNWAVQPIPAERGIMMLMSKIKGEDFVTEIPLPVPQEAIEPAAAIPDLTHATVALVTEGGLVPEDNPDKIESSSASRWARYPLEELSRQGSRGFKSIHAGYDARWVNADPNRMVPVDAARALEQAGVIGKLHEYYYVTVGTGTSVTNASRMGGEIAAQLVNEGVHAAIVTST
jgi:betaine reductase